MNLEAHLQRRWYGRPGWLLLLLPLEYLYRSIVVLRRWCYRRGWLSAWRAPVPIIVVGNVAVGGTGKTPVTIALCKALRAKGFTPGIISRGYGAQPPTFPYSVTTSSSSIESGDEPLLLAQRTGCPVVIAPQRATAAQYLLKLSAQQSQPQSQSQLPCDVLICDDGLQHYALARDIELVVVDGARGFGNGHCLPVGPLREALSRLQQVDAILINDASINDTPISCGETTAPQYAFQLQPSVVLHLASGAELNVAQWCADHPRVHAVAGIGNPQRFFNTLRALGCELIEHAFADHHAFSAADINFGDALPILMTEKDAVKCRAFAAANCWALRVEVELPDSLLAQITGKLCVR